MTTTQLEDFAEIASVELIVTDSDTKLRDARSALRRNDASLYSAFSRA